MATPAVHSNASLPTEVDTSVKVEQASKLEELIAQATARYAMKDYNAAAERYAFATELQADLNGEMSSANANLLYAYGRCLYHVAIKKSDVLGLSKISDNDTEAPNSSEGVGVRNRKQATKSEGLEEKLAEGEVRPMLEEQKAPANPDKEIEGNNKPYFQFTGDENFESSDDDESRNGNEGGDEDFDDEDDFSIAYEVLDMARVLLQKRKDEIEQSSTANGKEEKETRETRQIIEQLADTYDLQAEISLEGEKFPTAVTDLRSALELKDSIYPYESSVIAEAHYKLSLALEFSSVTQHRDEHGETKGDTHIDERMREEAAHELKAAISSCKLRIQKEEAKLGSGSSAKEVDLTDKEAQIDDVKDMVKELSQRLFEIRQAPVSISDSMGVETIDGANPLTGLLGSMLGESPAARNAKMEEASRNAHDLTGLVKKKKWAPEEVPDRSDLEDLKSKNGVKRKSDFPGRSEAGMEKKSRKESDEGG